MFRKNTVVVVGAGASYEAGLPIGVDLKKEISNLTRFSLSDSGRVRGDLEFYRQLAGMLEFQGNQNRVLTACSKISNGVGYVSSIDSFLEVHAGDPDIQLSAKAAIVKIIASYERGSKLNYDRSNSYNRLDPNRIQGTWYLELAHLLFEKVQRGNLQQAFEPVSFVSFNYDRCLEWFVYNALKGLYSLDIRQARSALEEFRVLHPYGSVGAPSWQSEYTGVEFGGELDGRLESAAKGLWTFTESADVQVISDIREAVSNAGTIVFLGFAFHPQNLELLRPDGGLSNVSRIYGTSYGMSDQDRTEVEEQLKRSFTCKNRSSKELAPDVSLSDLQCAQFMSQFRRTLAAT